MLYAHAQRRTPRASYGSRVVYGIPSKAVSFPFFGSNDDRPILNCGRPMGASRRSILLRYKSVPAKSTTTSGKSTLMTEDLKKRTLLGVCDDKIIERNQCLYINHTIMHLPSDDIFVVPAKRHHQ
jgi:hypothetical protein